MNDNWKEILESYNKAWTFLKGPRGVTEWSRDEENGRYHLWCAYHKAQLMKEKDPLLYARILSLMASEAGIQYSDYTIFNKYIKESYKYYKIANETNEKPTEKEFERIEYLYNYNKHEIESTNKDYEEQVKNIIGYEKLDNFNFHDSKVIWYEHSEKYARIKLDYNNMVVTFYFEEIIEIKINTEPYSDWVFDFYCYRPYHNKELVIFDIGLYKIMCKKILVEKIENIKIEN